MTSIDVSVFNRQSHRNHNSALVRQMFLPALGKNYSIKSGPSAKTIALAPVNDIDTDLAILGQLFDRRHFRHIDHPMSELVLDHVPVTFQLHDDSKVAVFVAKIDHNPVRDQYPEFFKDYNNHQLGSRTMLIQGWYTKILPLFSRKKIPAFNTLPLKRCVIFYDLTGKSKGYLAEVLDEQLLPATQVIRDAEALQYLLSAHFKGGFMESHAPDQKTRWGKVRYLEDQWVALNALYAKSEWKFSHSERGLMIELVGTTYYEREKEIELLGDAILCSDGTILHSYHFSRSEEEAELKRLGHKRGVPDDWRDGYYFNRFYPPNSPLVPKEVTESFNRDMPEWFKTELLLAKEAL